MFQSGDFVAENVTELEGGEVDEESIGVHGVKVGINKLYRLRGSSFISNESLEGPMRSEMYPRVSDVPFDEESDERKGVDSEVIRNPHYTLLKGNYVVEYDKIIKVPDDTVAYVYPCSHLTNSGVYLQNSIYKSGDEGTIEGGMRVDNQVFIKDGTHIASIVMVRASVHENRVKQSQGDVLNEQ